MPPWLLALSLVTHGDSTTTRPPDPWFAADKAKHAIVGFAVQSGSYAALRSVGDHGSALAGATAVTLGISLLKELRDRGSTGFSWRDLAWDAVGIVAASVVLSHRPQR